MRNCVISLGTSSYDRGRNRLIDSLKKHHDGDFYVYDSESDVNSPLHHDNPYAFKIYTFEKALQLGYKKILWIDCSVYAIKDMKPIFDLIESDGYVCQDAGHFLGHWTNDKTLDYFGLSRDEALKVTMYGNAGFLGLDFENTTAVEFYSQWKKSMEDGMFIGSWNNNEKTESQDDRCYGHRHDMSCGSAIRHKLGMKLQKGDELLQYIYDGNTTPNNETIILLAKGIN
jgi:hypothetical protein